VSNFFELPELQKQREQSGKRYLEFLRVPSMSAGIYTLAAGSADPQKPHKEDEMYYVVGAKGAFKWGRMIARSGREV